MSVGKSESLLRRDARAFCNKSNQRTIWEARRDERRTNQQLERELRHIERSRSYRERELDRDQVKFLNNFVEIFQRQCDIVAQRKSHVDVEEANREENDDEESQYDAYDEYMDGGQDTMTITTTDQMTSDATSGVQDKAEDNPEILLVAEMNRRRLRLHRDSILPIIYSPNPSEDLTPRYSSRPNSPRPLVISPSEPHYSMSDQGSESKKTDEKIASERASPDQDTPRSAANPSTPHAPRELKASVTAPHRRRLSPLNRFKIPESHFRAESPSSKNSTVYVKDVPNLGGSVRGDRVHRRGRLPQPSTFKSKLQSSKMGRRNQLDSQKRRDSAVEGGGGAPMDEMALNTKFMLEFEEASRNALDPYASGADIESIRKQFLVNTLAKKLKISALRSGHFAELDDIRKKIERRRKCVEEILEAKRKSRLIAKANEIKENGEEDDESTQDTTE